jgi:hypothetical protein
VIFKQTLEVNRIPPVRITSFHRHYVYLSAGNFLSLMFLEISLVQTSIGIRRET